MSVRADAETLRRIPIFADCESVHLQLLAFASERKKFATGEAIVMEGEQAGAAYLVLSGHAEIRQQKGKEWRTLARADPGSFLGEVAMIGKSTYAITALAAVPVAAACIDHSLFLRVANEYPEFGQTVFAALALRLEGSMREFDRVRSQFARGKSFVNL